MDDNNTPSLGEIWEFLVAFKETTVESFGRVERQISALAVTQQAMHVEFQGDMTRMEERLNRRITRVDDRLSEFQEIVMRRFESMGR